jgi:hypothetical protein
MTALELFSDSTFSPSEPVGYIGGAKDFVFTSAKHIWRPSLYITAFVYVRLSIVACTKHFLSLVFGGF